MKILAIVFALLVLPEMANAAAAAAYQTGSGGAGSLANFFRNLATAAVFIGIGWAILTAAWGLKDDGGTIEMLLVIIRGGVLLGIIAICLAVLT